MARRAVSSYIADPHRDPLENPLYRAGLHKEFLQRLQRIETAIGVPQGEILEEMLIKYSRIMSTVFHPDTMRFRLQKNDLPYEATDLWYDISQLVDVKDQGRTVIKQLIALMPDARQTERVILRVVETDNAEIKKAYDALVRENKEAKRREQALQTENAALKRQSTTQSAALVRKNATITDLEARLNNVEHFHAIVRNERDRIQQELDRALYDVHYERMAREKLDAPEKYRKLVYESTKRIYREAIEFANNYGAKLNNEWKNKEKPSIILSTEQFLRYTEERDTTGKIKEYFLQQACKVYQKGKKSYDLKLHVEGLCFMTVANLLDPTEAYIDDIPRRLLVRRSQRE